MRASATDASSRLRGGRSTVGATLPSFRFSEGLAGPGESTIVRLSRPFDLLEHLGIQDWLQASTSVVSNALAGLFVPKSSTADTDQYGRSMSDLLALSVDVCCHPLLATVIVTHLVTRPCAHARRHVDCRVKYHLHRTQTEKRMSHVILY
jgi:hypothetical protein